MSFKKSGLIVVFALSSLFALKCQKQVRNTDSRPPQNQTTAIDGVLVRHSRFADQIKKAEKRANTPKDTVKATAKP